MIPASRTASLLLNIMLAMLFMSLSCGRSEDECSLDSGAWSCDDNRVMLCRDPSPGGVVSTGAQGNVLSEKHDCDDYDAVCTIEQSLSVSNMGYCAFPDNECKEGYNLFCINNCVCICSDMYNHPLVVEQCNADNGAECVENTIETNAHCVDEN